MGAIYRVIVNFTIDGVEKYRGFEIKGLNDAKIMFRNFVKEAEDHFAKRFGTDGVSSFSVGGESGMSFDIRAIDCPMSNSAKVLLKEVWRQK